LRDTSSSLLTDDNGYDATSSWLAHRGGSSFGPWRKLRTLMGMGERWGGDSRHRTSAELTTLLNSGRGQALRDAHRTLRGHLEARPVLRQMAPHLSVLERGLAQRGSRALLKLPVKVLVQALEQLALLQREDQPSPDAEDLRVLQERLQETLALRNPRQRLPDNGPDTIAHHELLRGRGVEVTHISADEFDAVVREHGQGRRSRH